MNKKPHWIYYKFKKKKFDISGYNGTNTGLNHQDFMKLLDFQKHQCPLSHKKFEYDKKKKRFLDSEMWSKKKRNNLQAPPIDHDERTGDIRGILSENLNLLVGQWEQNAYGDLPEPEGDILKKYRENPPALECFKGKPIKYLARIKCPSCGLYTYTKKVDKCTKIHCKKFK